MMHFKLSTLSGIFRKLSTLYPRVVFYSTSEKIKQDEWVGVVGIEVHAQINSVSKLFSTSGTGFASPVNQNVSLFDAAFPGTLPVLNRRCVEAGVLTALALNCTLNPMSAFDRKHYFYADLPAGYQITQQRFPLARDGEVHFQVYASPQKQPYNKRVRLHQLQLEQDSGKSLHDALMNKSLIDLNRAGVPLMELVFEPDLSDGDEAAALVKELTLILTSLNTCLCKMEEGGLRVDANISVHKEGTPLGVRSEVKNIGSVRGVARAVDYEINRQRRLLQRGERVVNETRAWDAAHNCTVAMRDKEEKQDYRFMPEPNLPPLHLDMDGSCCHPNMVNVPDLAASLPELPCKIRTRLLDDYHLLPVLVVRLLDEPVLLRLFESVMKTKPSRNPTIVANLLITDLLTLVYRNLCSLGSSRPSIKDIGELTDLLQSQRISRGTARVVMEQSINEDVMSVSDIVSAKDLWLVTDPAQVRAECEAAIHRNPDLVEAYRKGKKAALKKISADVYKASQKIDMKQVPKQLEELLEKPQ